MHPLRSLHSTFALAAACAAALVPSARAISMRDDVPNVNSTGNDNPYVAFGASTAFDAVGYLSFTNTTGAVGSFTGTGMLVASSQPGVYKFLTAAHNVDGGANGTSPDGVPDASTYNLYFGARTSADGSTATGHVTAAATSVSISPQWLNGSGSIGKGASQYDLAVITFTLGVNVTGTLPTSRLGFSLANAQGRTGTMVGYGSYGLGNNFAGNAQDGVRRAGQNAIDLAGTNPSAPSAGFVLGSDFDSPRANANVLGSAVPLTLEAITAGGDSGGPLLVLDQNSQYAIVGVLNGGLPNASGRGSEYGSESIWASISQSENYAYLLSQGIAVPEPSTYALLGVGAAALSFAVRRRPAAGA